MTYGRTLALALSMLLLAGCGGGVAPSAQSALRDAQGNAIPAGSSAAAHILAHADTGRRTAASLQPQYDDGGIGSLQLPQIVACTDGTYSNDCADWTLASAATSTGPCPRTNPNCHAGVGADLNFCAAGYPSDIPAPALAPVAVSPQTLSLAYGGSAAGPILTFSTRPWAVTVTGTFSGTSTSAPSLTVAPVASPFASRGWLVFFTWSWPADVLLIPYQVNEIQVSAASSPLPLAGGSPTQLGAADCLGRSVTALALGRDFGFSADLRAKQAASRGPELNVPVWFASAASGSILLVDDRGATALTTVGNPTTFF